MRSSVCAVVVLGAWLAVFLFPARADVGGNVDAGKKKATQVCAACHGLDGNGGADPTWPKLSGQIPEYLFSQLQRFKSGARENPIMKGMAAALSEQEMKDVAAYYASQSRSLGSAGNKDLALEGQRIYRGGIAASAVPACMSCHGPSGHGLPPNYPRLYAQNEAYTETQLLDFKAGRRASADNIMPQIAGRMEASEIKAVAEYLTGLH
jgi:cytochrome c553